MKRLQVSALVIATALGWQAPASAETLRQALAATYTSNPVLLAQRAQLRATDEGVARAVSGFRPSVTGNYNYTYSDTETEVFAQEPIPQFDDDGNPVLDPTTGEPIILPRGTVLNANQIDGTSESYSVEGTQPIFQGLRNVNAKREAEMLVEAGRAQLLTTEQQVFLDAVTAYMNVYRDQAVLELNESNVQVLTRQLQASQDRFRVGEITRTDVAQSEARLAGAISLRIQAEADLETSRAAYRRVVGDYPGTLERPPETPPLPSTEEEALEIALSNNPAVMAARHTEEAAQYNVKFQYGALMPRVEAFANFSHFEGPQNFGAFAGGVAQDRYQVGARVSVPLYQSGAEYSDIRRSKQVKSQRRLEIFAAERNAVEAVRTAWEQYRASQASIESNSSQVRANEIALEGVRQEAAVGSRTTLDVLDAEQELLDSRVNLVRAQRNEYVAAFQLLSAIGRLNALSLDLDVELYNPEEHYKDVRYKFIGWGAKDGEDLPETR